MFTLRTISSLLIKCILFIIFIGSTLNSLAQQSRLAQSDKSKLIQFAQQRSARWTAQKSIADSIAANLNIPVFYVEKTGRVISLQCLGLNNKPVYYATDNLSVAATLSVDQVWSANNEYPELSGEGVEINLWDGGTVLATHQEFQSTNGSRITMRDLNLPVSDHSTHISGTMIAMGKKAEAKGMAGQALIKGWDLDNDIAEMASAASDGIVLSNHSYGPLCGWHYNAQNENWYWYGDPNISTTEDYEFGFYSDVSADLDYIAKLAPYYLIVKSAGNDRNDGPESAVSHYVWDEDWIWVNDEREPDGGEDGFDCLSPVAVAKNILTIGAVNDAKNITAFSGFGPTDDGRIKPDLVSDGVDVYSSISSTNTSYETYTGTSMSTAAATGSVALLLQLQNIIQPGVKLRSSTLKSVLMHSATDLGNPGPDYSFGWGLINIKAAADLLYNNSNNQGKNIYEKVLHEGEILTIPVKTAGDAPFLKATICWTDPAGQASSPALNQRSSKLVNDLNITIQNATTGQSFLPWVLNVESPATSATRGTNHFDNVEQVYFTNPGANDFNIKISHSGTLSGGSQLFSLVVTGIETQPEIYPPQNLTYSIGESAILLSWTPPASGVPDKYKIYRNDSFLAESNTPAYSDASIIFDNEYTYYVTAVYSINSAETESLGTNEVIIYPRTARSLPYIVDFETGTNDVQIKDNISGWQLGDSESLNCYYLDFSTNNTKFIGTDSYSAGDAVHVSDIAATPPLLLANYSNITLSFDYLLKTEIYDAIDELHVVYKKQEETEWHEFINLEKAIEWANKTIDLPSEICVNGTQLGFYYDDLYQWGMGAGLDNISVWGEKEQRFTDLTLTALNYPVSSCVLSSDEKVSISIKNLGPDQALAGDSITIQMACTSNENIEETVVLTSSLFANEVLNYELNSHLNLSDEQSYTFELLLTSALDNNSTNNSFEKTIEIYENPQPIIVTTDLTFCEDDSPVLIEAIPEGGVLSGTGVSGLYFDPTVSGPGIHTLTYTVTQNECVGETEFQVIVDSVIHPQILNENLSFCEDQQPVLIEAIPEGGVLSGTGVSGLYFDPTVSGPGIYTLNYTITENECVGETEFQVIVDSVIHPQILNENLSFCEDQPPVLIEAIPEGGVLSGTGVSGLYFSPALAGPGTHTLTYIVTENECVGETEFQVIVDSVIHPQILNENLSFCEDQLPVLIEAIPEGGVLSGTGVSGLYFDPTVSGPGIHTLNYTITENECVGETEFQVIVDSVIHPQILNENLSFCEDQPPVLIEAIPEGGVLSGAGVSGLYFDPTVSGPGIHTLTYTVTQNECVGEIEFQVIVDSVIHPQILNNNLSFCEDQQPVLIEAIPEGGVLSGTGVSGLYFDPTVSGPGIYTLNYTITENECVGETEFQVIVDSVIHPQILNENLSFCEDQPPVLIEAIPEGGVLSGTGVSGLYFSPALAGPGTHTLTYIVTENECVGETEFQVIVDSVIHPQILNENLSFCEDQLPVLIEAIPEGGVLSGTGVSGLYFDPTVSGPGIHTLNYTITENECVGETEFQVIVDSVIHPQILNENLSFCEDQPPVLIEAIPEGGVLSGAGVSGLYFDPTVSGPGIHTLTYTVTQNECVGEIEFQVIVDSVIHPQILNNNLSFCEDQQPVLIEAIPEGGVLSGAGVSGLYFDPTVSGPGTHTLTYIVTENECIGETEFQVNVDSVIHPQILNNNLSFCEDQQPVLIEAIPEGGVLSGTGVSGLYFDPTVSGVGIHTLTYTVTQNECVGETEFQVIVDSVIHPQILNENLSFCEDQPPVLIEAIPEGGVLSGTGVSGLYFDPTVSGPGTHTLTYIVTENECIGETEFQVIVYEKIEIDLGPDQVIGIEDSLSLHIPYLNCSVIWCDGTTNNNLTLVASELGLGIHPVWVEVSTEALCFSSDTMLLTVENLNAVSELKKADGILIYPNPTNKGFTVKLIQNEIIDELLIYDVTGEIQLNKQASTVSFFDVSFLTTGVYFIYIKTNMRTARIGLLKL